MSDIKAHFEPRLARFPGSKSSLPLAAQPSRLTPKAESDPVEALLRDAASSPRLLQPSDVATLLAVGVRTLERWRSTGEGPQYVRLSSKTIRYTDAAVAAFVAARVKANTAS